MAKKLLNIIASVSLGLSALLSTSLTSGKKEFVKREEYQAVQHSIQQPKDFAETAIIISRKYFAAEKDEKLMQRIPQQLKRDRKFLQQFDSYLVTIQTDTGRIETIDDKNLYNLGLHTKFMMERE